MEQGSQARESQLEQRVSSSAEASALTRQRLARQAAADVPVRRNRPANSSAKQRRRRLRKAYAAYNHLPKELQDNEFITTGYRVELGFWDTVKSLFGLHNETGNIWTHLIGRLQIMSLPPCTWSGHAALIRCIPIVTPAEPDSLPLTLLCRFCALSGADNSHSFCKASANCSQLAAASRNGEPAVHICTVQLGGR